MPHDPQQLAAEIKARARRLGFELCGVAPVRTSDRAAYLRRWVAEGRHGEMAWLADTVELRLDPGQLLPGARSIICCAMNYHVPLQAVPEAERPGHGRVARYALGRDYHKHLKKRLHNLADWLRELGLETRTTVDSAPIMEKELHQLAGVGWVGKNTCLINPQIGSWLLLGEILTTAELPFDEPVTGPDGTGHCGTCTRCIDACPTDAITGPHQLDATRCISYLTIEHRGQIDAKLRPLMGDWLYGCDICQDVCPFNAKAPAATEPDLQPRLPTGTLKLSDVLRWDRTAYRSAREGMAMNRVKLPVLQRNARIVQRNQAAAP